eukprot:5514115-Pyramimonas_sp.AAC.1
MKPEPYFAPPNAPFYPYLLYPTKKAHASVLFSFTLEFVIVYMTLLRRFQCCPTRNWFQPDPAPNCNQPDSGTTFSPLLPHSISTPTPLISTR